MRGTPRYFIRNIYRSGVGKVALTKKYRALNGNIEIYIARFPCDSTAFLLFLAPSPISSWAVQEQNRLWQALPKCRQAKLLLNKLDKSLARFALSILKKDLRILSGLLTAFDAPTRSLGAYCTVSGKRGHNFLCITSTKCRYSFVIF